MSEPKLSSDPSLPSSEYSREYYTTGCQGYREFQQTLGEQLPARLSLPLALADIHPGMRVLDVGCGRGEITLHCARRGAQVWGMDYAREAVVLARDALTNVAQPDETGRLLVLQSNARTLPLSTGSMDIAFMLDVVEHLYPHELEQALREVWRVLRPGGRLVVHTMPNLWYYHWGYPLFRAAQRLRGHQLPANPRERWPFHHVHVNEQTPVSLGRTLGACGYRARVWLRSTQDYREESNPLARRVMKFLVTVYPLRWIFCNDIFAIGVKS
jgi:cyclopropane fatty-acyl-phospholipid synthase-like methyltransferase